MCSVSNLLELTNESKKGEKLESKQKIHQLKVMFHIVVEVKL
jgi:hypothetical protein